VTAKRRARAAAKRAKRGRSLTFHFSAKKRGAARPARAAKASALATRRVRLNGEPVRVLEKGRGRAVGVLAGLLGWREWTPFLDALAEKRRVVVPSLPGHPGGGDFRRLDDLPDWIAATLDLLEASGLAGADLVAFGPGALLAAEVAAFSPASVGKLVLVAPFGLFDEREPVADVWAKRVPELPALYSTQPEAFARDVLRPPAGADDLEFAIEQTRALESAARLLWPFGDRGLAKRLHRIRARTLLVWGSDDRIVPASYAKRFAAGIRGPTRIRSIAGAGHRVDHDAPRELAAAIARFLA
jgi:pimeloyl-ACP methyl ester carboxylesterase